MKLKIITLTLALSAFLFCAEAQTARNPLNLEPARVSIQKHSSSWKIADEVFYHADGTQFDKRSYAYDESGRKTAEFTLRWNEADKTWRNTMQSEYRYEKEKEIVITKSGRFYESKTEVFFGSESKPAYSLIYKWNKDADDWQVNPSMRSEWVYDTNGRVTTLLKQYKNFGRDVFDARILYQYDESGALTEELFQTWNPEQALWTNKGRYAYSNDSEKQKTAISYFNVSGQWIFDGKTVYLYDEEGKITRSEYFNHATDKSFNAYSIINYSEGIDCPIIVDAKEIVVYPNPATTSFEMTVPDEYVGKIMYLFDLFGKQAKSVPVRNKKMQVDVSALSSGVYVLKIGDISKKISIQ
jgi:hypothetical protein